MTMRPPANVEEFANHATGMTLDEVKAFMNANVPGTIRLRTEGDRVTADHNPNRLNLWLNNNNVVVKARVG